MKKLFAYLSPHYPRMSLGLAIKAIGTNLITVALIWNLPANFGDKAFNVYEAIKKNADITITSGPATPQPNKTPK